MWVSQTYITNLNAEGAVSAYFLYESYRDDHAKLESRIRKRLGELAMSHGDRAHVFVPTKDARASIEKEFNEWLHKQGLEGVRLPGILVLQHPMGDPRAPSSSAVFVSFAELLEPKDKREPLLVWLNRSDEVFKKVDVALSELSHALRDNKSGLDKVLENLQLRPGL